jgi:hypothetical protein
MVKKMKIATIIIMIFASLILFGCSNTNLVSDNNVSGNAIANNFQSTSFYNTSSVDKIEIYHFHATSQCYSCKTVGAYAEETVNTYFADEVKSGKIVFGHINGELPENKELVTKYGATGSSLWIGTYTKDGKFSAEQNVNVWYKISDKNDYMNYLKGVIEQKLAGN